MKRITRVLVMAILAIGVAVSVAYAAPILTGTSGQDSIEFDLGDDYINFDDGNDWIYFGTGDGGLLLSSDWWFTPSSADWIRLWEDENGTDDALEIRADDVRIVANTGDIIFVLGGS